VGDFYQRCLGIGVRGAAALSLLSALCRCGGSTAEARAPAPRAIAHAAPRPSAPISESQPTEDDAETRASCDDQTCSPCGSGLCPSGWYCDESASGGPACGWLPQCARASGCACLKRVFGSACTCTETGGGAHVTCS
jgi:hypothetical protein